MSSYYIICMRHSWTKIGAISLKQLVGRFAPWLSIAIVNNTIITTAVVLPVLGCSVSFCFVSFRYDVSFSYSISHLVREGVRTTSLRIHPASGPRGLFSLPRWSSLSYFSIMFGARMKYITCRSVCFLSFFFLFFFISFFLCLSVFLSQCTWAAAVRMTYM